MRSNSQANILRRLPAEPLLASSSSAVPPVCSAKAEFFEMPEAAVAVPLVALDDELDEELDPLALETTGWLTGGGVTGANVAFALPKPRAAA